MTDKQEVIDIIETVYRGASKGRGLVVSPRGRFGFSLHHIAYHMNVAHDRLLDSTQVLVV